MSPITAYAFVDDTGDVGTRTASANHFAFGGYVVVLADSPAVSAKLAEIRQEFGFPPGQALHFKNYSHERRVRLAQVVSEAPVRAFAAVLCKRAGPDKRPWDPERLYNWMVRLVLERASWLFRDHGLYGSITFEHLKGANVDKTHAYVERLKSLDTEIAWDSIHTPLRFAGKATEERLQLADTIASATGGAFEGFGLGVTEQRYFRELEPRLWRRNGRLASYGLKIHPVLGCEPPCTTDDGHAWAVSL